LCLAHGESEETLALDRQAGGWFELVTARAAPGARYRYWIDHGAKVPDPASRFQPEDVHAASEVIDPKRFIWQDAHWRGRAWHESVIYELHVGSFSEEGTFAGVQRRLDYLADLGVTALELMPIADFPGRRNWGYDGVLPFAPDNRYGHPEDLKNLVQAAHAKGLMVFLDVVYNHFGPEGNYLHLYAPQFFNERHHTPWGAAINFDAPGSEVVREFFIHNALYWLEEYHFDGLRFDAVEAIADDSPRHFLSELATAVADGPGARRHIHLMLENDDNETRFFTDHAGHTAQWNGDLHHALHVLVSGETDGYYIDYADAPARHLARSLAEGFAYQGEPSAYRGGKSRGSPSAHLAPGRLIEAATAVLLLAPQTPLLFMGEEWGSRQPFPFFCDFEPGLAAKVRDGRRNEFAKFPAFTDPAVRAQIPDPNAETTFVSALLDWDRLATSEGKHWLALHRELLRVRRERITPCLAAGGAAGASYQLLSEHAFRVTWHLGEATLLTLIGNLGSATVLLGAQPDGHVIYSVPHAAEHAISGNRLPPWSAVWYLQDRGQAAKVLSDAA
jgi:maltooligosyltrehalose trehalohydrolase